MLGLEMQSVTKPWYPQCWIPSKKHHLVKGSAIAIWLPTSKQMLYTNKYRPLICPNLQGRRCAAPFILVGVRGLLSPLGASKWLFPLAA